MSSFLSLVSLPAWFNSTTVWKQNCLISIRISHCLLADYHQSVEEAVTLLDGVFVFFCSCQYSCTSVGATQWNWKDHNRCVDWLCFHPFCIHTGFPSSKYITRPPHTEPSLSTAGTACESRWCQQTANVACESRWCQQTASVACET